MSATTTMKTVVSLLSSMDKSELTKSQQRIKIGSLWAKLRAEYGKKAVSELKSEVGKANIRFSIEGSILNQWAGIAAFHAINPAIEKLSERNQRRFATLFDCSITKNGEQPKLLPTVNIPKVIEKCEFPKLVELAEDVDAFNKIFNVKLKKTVIKVTEKQVTDLFSRLRKMDDTERAKLVAQIRKELTQPMGKKTKAQKTKVASVPVPVVPVPVPVEDVATV